MMKLLECKKCLLISSVTLLIAGGSIGLSLIKLQSGSHNVTQVSSQETLESVKNTEHLQAIEGELKSLRLQVETLAALRTKPIDKMAVISLPIDPIQSQTDMDKPIEESDESAYEVERDAQLMALADAFNSYVPDVATSNDIEDRIVQASFTGELEGIEFASVTCVSTLCRVDIDLKEDALVNPDQVLSVFPFVGEVFATGNDEQASFYVARGGNPLPTPNSP